MNRRDTADEQIAEDEFDTVAAWTGEVLTGLPAPYAIPGACRGSGNPAALAWLAETLEIRPGTPFVDIGGGLGGPAAWLVEHYEVSPVLCDPMGRAAGWARRLFGLSCLIAAATELPLRSGRFEAAWALGVLSTVPDKSVFLDEVRRVLGPTGRLGLLEYVATSTSVPGPPAGNHFQDGAELRAVLEESGFEVVATVGGDSLPPAPESWRSRVDHVKNEIAAAHPGSPVLRRADTQQQRFADLLEARLLEARAVHAVVT